MCVILGMAMCCKSARTAGLPEGRGVHETSSNVCRIYRIEALLDVYDILTETLSHMTKTHTANWSD
jgi:hypothetical protein